MSEPKPTSCEHVSGPISRHMFDGHSQEPFRETQRGLMKQTCAILIHCTQMGRGSKTLAFAQAFEGYSGRDLVENYAQAPGTLAFLDGGLVHAYTDVHECQTQ
jgi:hypothetical protein